MKPFQIKYKIISEIRHGSPYKVAEIETIGRCNFELKRFNDWQDIHSWSTDDKYLAQVKWDIEHNEPGFRIVLFDSELGQVMQTDRVVGCCHKIRLDNNVDIQYETFTLTSKADEKKQFGIIKGKIITCTKNS